MKALMIWFAINSVVGQALRALQDGILTPAEMLQIAGSAFAAFGSNADFGSAKIEFNQDDDLVITIPKDVMDTFSVEIDLS